MNPFAAFTSKAILSLLILANPTQIFTQSDSIYRLPAGTRIKLKMDVELNSKIATVNDTFLAVVAKPVMIRDSIALPEGTVIEGRVTGVTRAAGGGKDGRLDLVFETLKTSQGSRPIDGFLITNIKAERSNTFKLFSILGGIAAGAVAGVATGGGNGGLIGAGIGAAAGTGIAFVRKGGDVRISKDQEFEIELKKEVLLPVLDY